MFLETLRKKKSFFIQNNDNDVAKQIRELLFIVYLYLFIYTYIIQRFPSTIYFRFSVCYFPERSEKFAIRICYEAGRGKSASASQNGVL